MTHANAIATQVVAALNAGDVPHMLVGAFSRNIYAHARATQDADIVISLGEKPLEPCLKALGPDFHLEPQLSFETNTGTSRCILIHTDSKFKIELFNLSAEAHDQKRFERRRSVEFNGQPTAVPTAEDVIITKLRWTRPKDLDDVRDIIAVQGDAAIDWNYVHHWTALHGTRAKLDEIRASIPPLD